MILTVRVRLLRTYVFPNIHLQTVKWKKCRLKELNYLDAAEFYPHLNEYDKAAFYSVFGGSPFINEFINEKKTLKENIIATILNPSHSVYNYAENLLISDFSNVSGAERILSALGNGKKKYGEIETQLRIEKNGLI